MIFNKERLAETIKLLDQADMPEAIDKIMNGEFDLFGDAALFAIQATALKVILAEYEKAVSEMMGVISKQDSIIEDMRRLL